MNPNNVVCRMCLTIISDKKTGHHIDEESGLIKNVRNIREMIMFCVPEMDIYISVNPTVCETCLSVLVTVYNFKVRCLRVENAIRSYIESNNLMEGSCVNLNNVVRQQIIEAFKQQNWPVKKIQDYIDKYLSISRPAGRLMQNTTSTVQTPGLPTNSSQYSGSGVQCQPYVRVRSNLMPQPQSAVPYNQLPSPLRFPRPPQQTHSQIQRPKSTALAVSSTNPVLTTTLPTPPEPSSTPISNFDFHNFQNVFMNTLGLNQSQLAPVSGRQEAVLLSPTYRNKVGSNIGTVQNNRTAEVDKRNRNDVIVLEDDGSSKVRPVTEKVSDNEVLIMNFEENDDGVEIGRSKGESNNNLNKTCTAPVKTYKSLSEMLNQSKTCPGNQDGIGVNMLANETNTKPDQTETNGDPKFNKKIIVNLPKIDKETFKRKLTSENIVDEILSKKRKLIVKVSSTWTSMHTSKHLIIKLARTTLICCDLCGFAASTCSVMDKHGKMCHKVCKICNFITDKLMTLQVHLNDMHRKELDELIKMKEDNRFDFQCVLCSFVGASVLDMKDHQLRVHIKMDVGNFKCPLCKKSDSTGSKIMDHLERAHVKQLRLECPLCNYTANSPGYAKRHLISHNLTKVKCTLCPSSFKTAFSLNIHTKKKHPETQDCNSTGMAYAPMNSDFLESYNDDYRITLESLLGSENRRPSSQNTNTHSLFDQDFNETRFGINSLNLVDDSQDQDDCTIISDSFSEMRPENLKSTAEKRPRNDDEDCVVVSEHSGLAQNTVGSRSLERDRVNLPTGKKRKNGPAVANIVEDSEDCVIICDDDDVEKGSGSEQVAQNLGDKDVSRKNLDSVSSVDSGSIELESPKETAGSCNNVGLDSPKLTDDSAQIQLNKESEYTGEKSDSDNPPISQKKGDPEDSIRSEELSDKTLPKDNENQNTEPKENASETETAQKKSDKLHISEKESSETDNAEKTSSEPLTVHTNSDEPQMSQEKSIYVENSTQKNGSDVNKITGIADLSQSTQKASENISECTEIDDASKDITKPQTDKTSSENISDSSETIDAIKDSNETHTELSSSQTDQTILEGIPESTKTVNAHKNNKSQMNQVDSENKLDSTGTVDSNKEPNETQINQIDLGSISKSTKSVSDSTEIINSNKSKTQIQADSGSTSESTKTVDKNLNKLQNDQTDSEIISDSTEITDANKRLKRPEIVQTVSENTNLTKEDQISVNNDLQRSKDIGQVSKISPNCSKVTSEIAEQKKLTIDSTTQIQNYTIDLCDEADDDCMVLSEDVPLVEKNMVDYEDVQTSKDKLTQENYSDIISKETRELGKGSENMLEQNSITHKESESVPTLEISDNISIEEIIAPSTQDIVILADIDDQKKTNDDSGKKLENVAHKNLSEGNLDNIESDMDKDSLENLDCDPTKKSKTQENLTESSIITFNIEEESPQSLDGDIMKNSENVAQKIVTESSLDTLNIDLDIEKESPENLNDDPVNHTKNIAQKNITESNLDSDPAKISECSLETLNIDSDIEQKSPESLDGNLMKNSENIAQKNFTEDPLNIDFDIEKESPENLNDDPVKNILNIAQKNITESSLDSDPEKICESKAQKNLAESSLENPNIDSDIEQESPESLDGNLMKNSEYVAQKNFTEDPLNIDLDIEKESPENLNDDPVKNILNISQKNITESSLDSDPEKICESKAQKNLAESSLENPNIDIEQESPESLDGNLMKNSEYVAQKNFTENRFDPLNIDLDIEEESPENLNDDPVEKILNIAQKNITKSILDSDPDKISDNRAQKNLAESSLESLRIDSYVQKENLTTASLNTKINDPITQKSLEMADGSKKVQTCGDEATPDSSADLEIVEISKSDRGSEKKSESHHNFEESLLDQKNSQDTITTMIAQTSKTCVKIIDQKILEISEMDSGLEKNALDTNLPTIQKNVIPENKIEKKSVDVSEKNSEIGAQRKSAEISLDTIHIESDTEKESTEMDNDSDKYSDNVTQKKFCESSLDTINIDEHIQKNMTSSAEDEKSSCDKKINHDIDSSFDGSETDKTASECNELWNE